MPVYLCHHHLLKLSRRPPSLNLGLLFMIMITIINNTLALITSPQVNLQDNFSPALDSYLKNDRGQAILLLPILFNHLIWISTHLLLMEGPSQRLLQDLHLRRHNLLEICSLILIPSTSTQQFDRKVDRWSDISFSSAVSAQITPVTTGQQGHSSYSSYNS